MRKKFALSKIFVMMGNGTCQCSDAYQSNQSDHKSKLLRRQTGPPTTEEDKNPTSNGSRPSLSALPDPSIFKEMEIKKDCGANLSDCPSLHRIKSLMTYHRLTAMKGAEGQALFIEFCDNMYSKQALLTDYIHFITKHSDRDSKATIVAELKCECPSVDKCARTERHLRDRGRDQAEHINFYIDTFDTIHFNLFHLEHVGLRVADVVDSKGDGYDEQKDADEHKDNCVLAVVGPETRRIADAIAKRVSTSASHRVDDANHSKFNALGGNALVKQEGGKGMFLRVAMCRYISLSGGHPSHNVVGCYKAVSNLTAF